jgi:iron complex transport system permease protein
MTTTSAAIPTPVAVARRLAVRRVPRIAWVSGLLLLLLAAGMLVSVGVGGHDMPFNRVLDVLLMRTGGGASATVAAESTIIWRLRLPRTLLAVLVGINLAVSGVLLQGIMRNPLAAPDIIGVTAGAGLAATVVIVLAPAIATLDHLGVYALPGAAFLGALAASVTVFGLSWQPGVGTSPVRMILAGVAVSAMIGGFQGFLMVYFSDRVQGVILWLAGSLNTRSWHHVMLVGPFTMLGLMFALPMVRSLNLLQLGEEVAGNLGVHVNRTRILAIVAASLLTGSAVCAVGIIGFLGLVIPHIMRLTVGHRHGLLLPAALLAGAVTMLWADVGARMLNEMPVGVITAMIGGPYFVALLYGRKLV